GGDVVSVIEKQARTDVEPVAKRSDVHQSFDRAVVQSAVILDAIGLEAVAEAHSVAANANVGQRGQGHADIAADAEHRKLGYYAEARLENAFRFGGRRRCRRRCVVATGKRERRRGNGRQKQNYQQEFTWQKAPPGPISLRFRAAIVGKGAYEIM